MRVCDVQVLEENIGAWARPGWTNGGTKTSVPTRAVASSSGGLIITSNIPQDDKIVGKKNIPTTRGEKILQANFLERYAVPELNKFCAVQKSIGGWVRQRMGMKIFSQHSHFRADQGAWRLPPSSPTVAGEMQCKPEVRNCSY